VLLKVSNYTLAQLKNIISSGGPVFPLLAGDITIKFPQAKTTIIFGSTEAKPISYISTAEVGNSSAITLKKLGLPVGQPAENTAIVIIPFNAELPANETAATWAQLQCPPGKEGEIVVTGPHIVTNYTNNPAAEAATKVNVNGIVWHRTGDAGRVNENGALYYLGRAYFLPESDQC
jgi:acyl-CoA synthetase (AMP-forming)/AMP-acid ligase II